MRREGRGQIPKLEGKRKAPDQLLGNSRQVMLLM